MVIDFEQAQVPAAIAAVTGKRGLAVEKQDRGYPAAPDVGGVSRIVGTILVRAK